MRIHHQPVIYSFSTIICYPVSWNIHTLDPVMRGSNDFILDAVLWGITMYLSVKKIDCLTYKGSVILFLPPVQQTH